MKPWLAAAGLTILAGSIAFGGDLHGHLLINRKLAKKVVVPVVYDLRGQMPPSAPSQPKQPNEYQRVVVWLEGNTFKPKAPVTATINQRGAAFNPDMLVIPTGSSIDFLNSDPIFHNVFSLSSAKPFDLGFYPRGEKRSVRFTHAGVVQVYCHLHAQMYAVIVVTSSPWYGKPSADGTFSFSGIPAGHYRVLAWHKVAGLTQTEVDIPEHGAAEVTIGVPITAEDRP
ncbi:MAG TPA: hypothetical protein VG675_23915 [Bryobacteraceae bacterium]|nr:hypothetical protein [Bryobacteraceae bacterium]